MANSPNLILPYVAGNQDQKHVTVNEGLRKLDVLTQLSIKDRDLTAPPGSPADGDRYMPASGATGAWSTWDLNIAAYQDGAWVKYSPRLGWRCWVEDEERLLVYVGAPTYWDEVSGGGGTPLTEQFNVVVAQSGGVTAGIKGDIVVAYDCTIVSAMLLADQAGDIVVDIWKDTYANFPPTNADSITGGNEPELTADLGMIDTTLTGWTVSLTAGDVLRFNVDSAATLERCLIVLIVERV